MHDPLADQHDRASGHPVAGNLVFHDRATADDPGGWIESHGLGEHRRGIRQAMHVSRFGPALFQDHVELSVQPSLDLGMLTQQVPAPGERVRGCLMSREEKGHGLVAQLLVGHPAASLFILREQQHREEIAPVLRGSTALCDQAIDRRVEPCTSLEKAPGGRERQPLQQWGERQAHVAPKEFHAGRNRLANLLRLALHVRSEQSLGYDGERYAHHLGVDVDHGRPIAELGPPLG